jgi:hypothetical protein
MPAAYLSRQKLESILKDLRQGRPEFSNIDCKEMLNLSGDGNRATFIRHVAAFANAGCDSFMIIGIEDKTWASKGIDADSFYAKPDEAQQQMNQTLASRIDPPITVTYQTYKDIDCVLLGVIGISGENLPYVISILDDRFGGNKEKGEKSYIYKGAVYIRRGADSVIANKQSEVLNVVNGRRDLTGVALSLGFIAMLVSVGIGVGISTVKFSDLYGPTILGGIWGLFIGWLLHTRVRDLAGRFPTTVFGKALQNLAGPVWGALTGVCMGFTLGNSVLGGKLSITIMNPLLMGLFIAPGIVLLYFLLPLAVGASLDNILTLAGKALKHIFKRIIGGNAPKVSDNRDTEG